MIKINAVKHIEVMETATPIYPIYINDSFIFSGKMGGLGLNKIAKCVRW